MVKIFLQIRCQRINRASCSKFPAKSEYFCGYRSCLAGNAVGGRHDRLCHDCRTVIKWPLGHAVCRLFVEGQTKEARCNFVLMNFVSGKSQMNHWEVVTTHVIRAYWNEFERTAKGLVTLRWICIRRIQI